MSFVQLRLLEGIDFEWIGSKITGFVPVLQFELS